jgi:hypothetical protein
LICLSVLLGLGACSTVAEKTPTTDEAPAQSDAPPAAEAETPSAPQADVDDDDDVLEKSREAVRSGVEWLARGLDSWFGDKPFERGRAVRSGRLGLRTSWREDDGFDYGLRFRARLDLPNLREKTFLFIGRDDEREIVTDRPEELSRQERLQPVDREDRAFFIGAARDVTDKIQLRAGVRGGLQFYAQARYEEMWMVSARDQLQFRETVFWTSDDRFGSTTVFSADHAFSPALALRWVSSGTISQETEGFEWSSGLGLHKSFGPLTSLSTEVLINGETGTDVDVSEYGLRVIWRQPVYRDWLLGEFTVGHFWDRDDVQSPRTPVWAFGVAVEMRF